MKEKIDDVIFWILILAAIAVILWLLHGSPTLENALVSVGIFIISSHLFLWKKYFEMDKKTAVSFVRFRSDLENKYQKIDDKLEKIERLVKAG